MKNKNRMKLFMTGLAVLLFTGTTTAQTVIETVDIAKADSVIVAPGTTINNLIVRADKFSCGQLIIQSGVVKVKRMTYIYTVTPSEWIPVSFPTDITNVNLATSSNLATLGFTQNSGTKRYYFKRYDSEARSNEIEPWIQTTTPDLKGGRGYLFCLYTGVTTPVDVEFYFDNLSLDKNKTTNQVLVDVDMAGKSAQTDYQMTIKPANVKGNTLAVTVQNAPTGAMQPINYRAAVEAARLYFTEDNNAVRISLPSSESCKVLFMDKRMKKVLMAVDYVSPGAIPVDQLKKGKYKVLLEYGKATDIKEFVLK